MKTLFRTLFAAFGLMFLADAAHAQVNLLIRKTDSTTQPFYGDANGNSLDSVGASAVPTNTITVLGLTPTSAANLLVIESGPTKTTIIRHMTIWPGISTANGYVTLTINRNTVAATAAGTAATGTAMQHDQGDAVFSGIVRSGAFTVVGVTVTATNITFEIPSSVTTTTTPPMPMQFDFTNGGTQKGIVIPVGILNGIMISHPGVAGAADFGISVDFTEQ
jgi:hypothetical protein